MYHPSSQLQVGDEEPAFIARGNGVENEVEADVEHRLLYLLRVMLRKCSLSQRLRLGMRLINLGHQGSTQVPFGFVAKQGQDTMVHILSFLEGMPPDEGCTYHPQMIRA
ncbi:hypothetical protein HAX54_041527 [Datura stramonium]|uniref:Uncharacterized protein n=1 Tax=Datura stramonium TaxID=4076 RepID=A0ABS8RH21_DATST|nr:hypothetical protein [Datura stramonium]